MAPLQPAQRVVRDAARVATPLGKDGRAAEVESASLNVNLREPNRSVDSAVDAKIGGIQPLVWVENNVDPVVAHAQRVGHRWPEDVILGYRSDLTAGRSCVTPSGEGIALQRGLLPQVLLDSDISVQAVFASQLHVDVASPLVDVDWCEGRADEERKPVFGGVRCGDQCCERLDSRIRARLCCSLICWRKDQAVDGYPLALPQCFIAGKEMRAIPANRSAGGRPKIVPFEWRLGHAGGVEKVPGVHRAIAEEIKKLTVEFVGARARGDVDDGSRISAVFSAVRGVLDSELGYRVDGRLEGDLILNHITEVDAVHQEVDGVFPLSCGVESE